MIFSILAFLLFAVCVVSFKAGKALPVYELKRRAQSGNAGLQAIYRAVGYGPALDITLWLGASGFLSLSIVLAFDVDARLAVLLIFLAIFTITFTKLSPATRGPFWFIAKLAARPASLLAGLVYPLSSAIFKNQATKTPRSTVFEKQDLINMMKSQKNLQGNRISERDLQVVEAALKFSGKSVSEVMAAGTEQCFVSGNEPIGPLLMDELHSRGRFAYLVTKGPVKRQGSKPTGTLFVRDLVGHQTSGKVKDVAQEQVFYVNEAQPISDALEAMLKTQFPILAVINSFEEVSGVVSLEDIINQLLPDFMGSDFENYANSKVVANWKPQNSGTMSKQPPSSEKSSHTV